MPRQIRIQYEGAIYHVMNRGHRKGPIFKGEADYLKFPFKEAAEAKAQRILREELRKLRWTTKELGQRRKGDPEKVRIARRLRKETTVTLKWVAEHLQMGSWSYAANQLYACQKSKK